MKKNKTMTGKKTCNKTSKHRQWNAIHFVSDVYNGVHYVTVYKFIHKYMSHCGWKRTCSKYEYIKLISLPFGGFYDVFSLCGCFLLHFLCMLSISNLIIVDLNRHPRVLISAVSFQSSKCLEIETSSHCLNDICLSNIKGDKNKTE